MRKLLFILSLFIAVGVYAQPSISSVGAIASSGGEAVVVDSANWEQEYKDYYYEIADAGRPSLKKADPQNDLFRSLVDSSFWDRIDWWYVLAQNTEAGALLNIVDPGGDFDATNVSSTQFDSYEGFTGDGTADYLTSNFNPANATSPNYVLNSGTVGAYSRTDIQESSDLIGNASISIRLMPWYNGNTYYRVNQSASSSTSSTASLGLYIATRRGASDVEAYKNGVSISSATTSSGAIASGEIWILHSSSFYGTRQVSIAFMMDGVTDTEAASLNTIIETYMDAIGKGVQ